MSVQVPVAPKTQVAWFVQYARLGRVGGPFIRAVRRAAFQVWCVGGVCKVLHQRASDVCTVGLLMQVVRVAAD
jgi:hypothetical protein